MSLGSRISFAIRCALPVVGIYYLAGCVVSGSAQARPSGTITVQPAASASVSTTTYAQPTYTQPQPVYTQPTPVYTAPTAVATTGVSAGVYAAPAPVVGGFVAVNPNWTTNGYVESDYLTYNMTMRARQFAAGYIPVTQMYRSQMMQGQNQFVTVTAQPGRCYRIIGVGGQGVRDLDLRLRDQSGNVVDQDVATDNFPVLGLQRQLCLNWTGTFQIEVIMYSGGGEFGVQAFATSP